MASTVSAVPRLPSRTRRPVLVNRLQGLDRAEDFDVTFTVGVDPVIRAAADVAISRHFSDAESSQTDS